MYKKYFIFIGLLSICFTAKADILPLDDALRATYTACVGIDEELSDLKKMAGINTVITATGTGLGIGAVATGIAKVNVDKILESKYREMEDLSHSALSDIEEMDEEETISGVEKALDLGTNQIPETDKNNDIEHQTKIDKLEAKSKKYGKWRTGLLAGNTVTNVAGTVIAGNNRVNKDLYEQIDDCKSAVRKLKDSIVQAKFSGEDVSEATQIQSICSGFEYVDIDKINKRATGAMVSSAIGAGTGVVGTITSILANSDKIRNDNSATGKQKEANLNTTSNVLAGTATVASATATIFNATQIKAIKNIVTVAQQCTEVLK